MRRLTAVDDRDRHKNTSPTADRTHQVGDDKQETEDGITERRCGGDDALELLYDERANPHCNQNC